MRIIPPDQPRTPGPRILFAEDFDDLPAPASAPEPEQPPPAPMLTEADVEAARREGHAAGLHAARQQAWMHLAEATAVVCRSVSEQLPADLAQREADLAEMSEAIARLFFAALAAQLPSLALRHAASEITHLVRDMMGDLALDCAMTVAVAPALLDELRSALSSLPHDLARRIVLQADPRVEPGDARLDWEAGAATRQTRKVQQALDDALRTLDLLPKLKPAAPLQDAAPIQHSERREAEHA